MTKRFVRLRLEEADSERELETVSVLLDPEDGGTEYEAAVSRHFTAMACRAADEDERDDDEDMPWLHHYTLVVLEQDNDRDELLRFRRG